MGRRSMDLKSSGLLCCLFSHNLRSEMAHRTKCLRRDVGKVVLTLFHPGYFVPFGMGGL